MSKNLNTADLCGEETPRGLNITTASGYPYWPVKPAAADIRIEDIAAHLSRICRFNGAMKHGIYKQIPGRSITTVYSIIETYSVAQHSLHVEENLRPGADDIPGLRLAALLHDAEEYVEGDDIKPCKEAEKAFYAAVRKALGADKLAEIERVHPSKFTRVRKTRQAIARRFGFSVALFDHPLIKEQDYRAVLTEHRDLQNNYGVDWGLANAKAKPWDMKIVPELPSVAKAKFLARFNELYTGE